MEESKIVMKKMGYKVREEIDIFCSRYHSLREVDGVMTFVEYTCMDMEENFPKWDNDWIKKNREDINRPSRAYLEWKSSIEKHLNECKCKREREFYKKRRMEYDDKHEK